MGPRTVVTLGALPLEVLTAVLGRRPQAVGHRNHLLLGERLEVGGDGDVLRRLLGGGLGLSLSLRRRLLGRGGVLTTAALAALAAAFPRAAFLAAAGLLLAAAVWRQRPGDTVLLRLRQMCEGACIALIALSLKEFEA